MHQSTFWSEWKINVDIPYEDISGNVRLSQGAMLISTKVCCLSQLPFSTLPCRTVSVYITTTNIY